eukprot:1900743-Prymnesium_polylepis.2
MRGLREGRGRSAHRDVDSAGAHRTPDGRIRPPVALASGCCAHTSGPAALSTIAPHGRDSRCACARDRR